MRLNLRNLYIRILIIFTIVFVIVVSIYFAAGVQGLQKFWDSMGPNLLSSMLSFLFGYLIWGWLAETQKENDKVEINQKIDDTSSKLELLINSSRKEFNDNLQNLNKNINEIEQNSKSIVQLDSVIQAQQSKVQSLIFGMKNSKSFIRNYFTDIMRTYHDQFVINSDGFHIKDEQLSLIAYIQFWKYMNTCQIERKREAEKNGFPLANNCIIARINHSNSIHIWTNCHSRYSVYTNELLLEQKKFIEYGGVIIRILLGPDENPNDDYKKAIKAMQDHKVEVKYLKQTEHNARSSDFLLLHDEQLVYMWQADNTGNSLSETLIHQKVDKAIYNRWHRLYNELKNKGDEPITIPTNRHIEYTEL